MNKDDIKELLKTRLEEVNFNNIFRSSFKQALIRTRSNLINQPVEGDIDNLCLGLLDAFLLDKDYTDMQIDGMLDGFSNGLANSPTGRFNFTVVDGTFKIVVTDIPSLKLVTKED